MTSVAHPFYTHVSRRAVLCDWVWRVGGLPHRFPHNKFSSVYWIFTKLDHMIPLWKGKNPIYFGVITIIPFDNLYRQAYFVMHTFLVTFELCSNVSRSLSDSLFFPSMDILIRGSKFLWVNLDLKRSFNQIHVWKAPLHRGSRGRDEVCMLLEKSVIKPFLQSWYKL
jgi:hypothetical protein